MRRSGVFPFCLIQAVCAVMLLVGCKPEATQPSSDQQAPAAVPDQTEAKGDMAADTVPEGARRLIAAYPDMDMRYVDNQMVIAGETVPYDDGKPKSFVEQLDDCDVEDMFAMPYDTSVTRPDYLSDPGRGRCEALYKAMYGHNASEVAKNLVDVRWFGQTLQFTRINGANKQLEAVERELKSHPEWSKYFAKSSTFYWRKVRGANRLSAHSYGMTIDINVANSDYWQWANPGKGELDKIDYKNRIPLEIVGIFEKHGFIWGGRWYHFDTMHFEYRPELL